MTSCTWHWLLVAGLIAWPLAGPSPLAAQSNPRLTVIISDLHMGVGQNGATNTWHALEDFRWQEEFALFLKHIDSIGNRKADLVLNGDTFELWQSLKDDCVPSQKELGCTEEEALDRARRVFAAHQQDLTAIGTFADSGDNRVVIVPGNHDAGLLFERVEQAVLAAIPSKPGRVRISKEGFWRSADGKLYAEHGHQIGRKPDKENWSWPKPFLAQSGHVHLQQSSDERILQAYVNRYEKDVPVVDNTPEQEDALRIILASGPEAASGKVDGDVFGALLFKTIWKDLAATLGSQSGEPPVWDIKAIRDAGDRFFIESFPSDDPVRVTAEVAFQPGHQSLSVNDLDGNEINAICDQRAALVKLQQKEKSDGHRDRITVTECPRKEGALGAAATYLLRSRDKMYTAHLEQTFEALADAKMSNPGFDVFISGSTHIADAGFRPRGKDWNPLVMNSGAWQRLAMKKDLDVLRAAPERKSSTDAEFLRSLRPEELPACYSALVVEPYADKPQPALRYWIKGEGSAWRFNDGCR